jgi:hypothetical protein
VRCYKTIYTIVFLVISFSCFAQVGPVINNQEDKNLEILDSVVPLGDERRLQVGEIYKVKIESQKRVEDLRQYQYKKINSFMYVMDFLKEDKARVFEVFIINPPKENKKNHETELFTPIGFQLVSTKSQTLPEYLKIPISYDLKSLQSISWRWWAAIISIFLFVVSWFLYPTFKKIQKNKKKRKRKKQEVENLIRLLEMAKEKKDFEEIYSKKKEILNNLDLDRRVFNDFINEIRSKQFRADWKDLDLDSIKKKQQKLLADGISSGI